MNAIEFQDWYKFHCSVFPGVKSWMRRHGLDANEIVSFWRRQLENVGLEEGKSASTRLYELEAQPKSYERHPAEIKRLCRKSTNQEMRLVTGPRSDGTVSCLRCKDFGLITVFYIRDSKVFDRTAVAQNVIDNGGDESELSACCVRCVCASGDRFTSHPVWRDFMLESVWCAAYRRAENFWQDAIHRPSMAGSNQTMTAAELAATGAF